MELYMRLTGIYLKLAAGNAIGELMQFEDMNIMAGRY